MLASEDNTEVMANGDSFTLNAGESRLVEVAGSSESDAHARVTANRPITVAQFSMTTVYGKNPSGGFIFATEKC